MRTRGGGHLLLYKSNREEDPLRSHRECRLMEQSDAYDKLGGKSEADDMFLDIFPGLDESAFRQYRSLGSQEMTLDAGSG